MMSGENFTEDHVEFNGKIFVVLFDLSKTAPFLKDSQKWDKDWIKYCCKHESKIEILTADHQNIMNALQDYFNKNKIVPMLRILSKTVNYSLKMIYELFPNGGPARAIQMAGLPQPILG